MIKHIVFWNFKEKSEGLGKEKNIQLAKNRLMEMVGKVPTIHKLEVGLNFSESGRAMDMALYTEFHSKEDMKKYQDHPEHQKVKDFLAEVTFEACVVDYEA